MSLGVRYKRALMVVADLVSIAAATFYSGNGEMKFAEICGFT
jgi:hypothetical protein